MRTVSEDMPSDRRVGILGGTFDPIHCGHLDAGSAAMSALGLTELLVVPSHVPPHRPQPYASSFHRFAMVALTVAGRADWYASDLELRHEAPSYTSVTLQRLHECGFAPSELFFVVGADAFGDVRTWKDYPDIFRHANFAVVSRPGFPVSDLAALLPDLSSRMFTPPLTTGWNRKLSIFLINAPTANVSATAIRLRRRNGQSIAGLVSPGVQQHIERHGLYSLAIDDQSGRHRAPHRVADNLYGQD